MADLNPRQPEFLAPLTPEQKSAFDVEQAKQNADFKDVNPPPVQDQSQGTKPTVESPTIDKNLRPTLDNIRAEQSLDSTLPDDAQRELIASTLNSNGEGLQTNAFQVMNAFKKPDSNKSPETK